MIRRNTQTAFGGSLKLIPISHLIDDHPLGSQGTFRVNAQNAAEGRSHSNNRFDSLYPFIGSKILGSLEIFVHIGPCLGVFPVFP